MEAFSKDLKNWIRTELWNQVPVSISVIDRDFEIVEANYHFAENYGHWGGRPCYEVYKGRNEQCERCAAAKTFTDGQVRIREELGIIRGEKQS